MIHRQNQPGDRRDYYVCEPDMWRMLFRIAVERKKREFDPALHALRHLMAEADTERQPEVHARLAEMEQLLSTLDGTAGRFLQDEQSGRSVFQFFTTFNPDR